MSFPKFAGDSYLPCVENQEHQWFPRKNDLQMLDKIHICNSLPPGVSIYMFTPVTKHLQYQAQSFDVADVPSGYD
jgi:hypothetical protein